MMKNDINRAVINLFNLKKQAFGDRKRERSYPSEQMVFVTFMNKM